MQNYPEIFAGDFGFIDNFAISSSVTACDLNLYRLDVTFCITDGPKEVA